jgi:hypothetical protein
MHGVTIVACKPHFDLWPLWMAGKFSGWIFIPGDSPHWNFLTSDLCERLDNSRIVNSDIQSLRSPVNNKGLRVNCPLLLSEFGQNLNVSTNFSKTLQYKIS